MIENKQMILINPYAYEIEKLFYGTKVPYVQHKPDNDYLPDSQKALSAMDVP
jgi:hypothetical protein